MNLEIVSKGLDVADLRAGIAGAVAVPGDAGYDEACLAWNRIVEQAPHIIVDAENVADVQAAVAYAKANDLCVGVINTGHGMPRGCDGVLIRMARMNGVRIDPETRIAKIGGGALIRDVLSAAAPYGLAFLSGSSPNLGVVGYTLGGGFGLMVRRHGLAIDRLREAKVVTPDGHLVAASATENPDLFWAIRGGGGAFGVVVEITVELVSQATVYGGATFYPAEDAPKVLRAFAALCREMPESVSMAAMLMNLPPLPTIPPSLRGRAVVAVNACVCGDLQDAAAQVGPLRELGTPILDAWGEFPYEASSCIYNDPTDPMPSFGSGAMLKGFSETDAERLLAAIGPLATMPQVVVQIRHIGGAMARVAHEETPVGCMREAEFLVYAVGVPNPFASAAAIHGHAEELFEALAPSLLCRGPLNFIGEGNVKASAVRGAFGETEYARLRRVKESVDPTNAFRFASVGLID